MKTNQELQKDVMDELKWDSRTNDVATQIGVSAKDGVVTLSGLVSNYGQKLAVERAAQRVNGVKVVASDVEVGVTGISGRTDTQIAEAIRNALRWNSALLAEKIDVKVDNGWVSLSGEVEWAYQKNAVEDSINDLLGVKGVTNLITLKAKPVDTREIKDKISAAFHRSATVDSRSIRLDTVGSRVTIHGTVRSWAEKKEAERIVWSSPGVLSVDNQIEIESEIFV
jgi:osmotically-inducible protein OsmY